jgi:hypothetical protein
VSDMTDRPDNADEWFEVDFDDNTDGVEDEAGLTGVPAAFLARLRGLTPDLASSGFSALDTSAWYEAGRLTVALQIRDNQARMMLRALRLEIGNDSWIAAWVSPARFDQPEFQYSDPEEQTGGDITDAEQGVGAAIGWLQAQVRRPIVRYVWHDGGRIVARNWRFADDDRPLVGSGDVELINRPESADERVQVRP